MAECKKVYAELVYKENGYVDNIIYVMDPEKGLRKVVITNIEKVEMTTPGVSGDKCEVIKADMELSSNDIDLKGGLDKAIIENLVYIPRETKFECPLDTKSLFILGESKEIIKDGVKYYLKKTLDDDNIVVDEIISKKNNGENVVIRVRLKLFGKSVVPINLVFLNKRSVRNRFDEALDVYIEYNDKLYKIKDLYKIVLEKTIRG